MTFPQPPDPEMVEGPFDLTIRLEGGHLVDLLVARLILVILDELQASAGGGPHRTRPTLRENASPPVSQVITANRRAHRGLPTHAQQWMPEHHQMTLPATREQIMEASTWMGDLERPFGGGWAGVATTHRKQNA